MSPVVDGFGGGANGCALDVAGLVSLLAVSVVAAVVDVSTEVTMAVT